MVCAEISGKNLFTLPKFYESLAEIKKTQIVNVTIGTYSQKKRARDAEKKYLR